MYMPYQDLNVTVPAIPTDVAQYAYATENALVALPPACVQAHSLTPNLADRDGSLTMRYFRVSSSAAEYATLASYADCACGLVILLHGSSGATWSSVMYAKMMANVGHVVVMPDSMAMPDSMGLKGSGTLKTTAEIDTSDYWGSSKPYTGSCSWAGGKPFCYSTKTENIVHDSAAYREFVERNYLIRKLELDYLVQSQTALLNAFDKVVLLGRSEGAYIAARYHNAALDAKLYGRILSGYSCEFNYFSSCADNAKICGDQCRKDVRQLNIVGDMDAYFGLGSSVSVQVAADADGYGGPITGNCRAAYDNQQFTTGVVVVLSSGHSVVPKFDNAVRSLFADFVNNAEAPSSWASLDRAGCNETSTGIWSCNDTGDGSLARSDSWGGDVVTSWSFLGTNSSCPPGSADASAAARSLLGTLGLAIAAVALLLRS